MSDCENFANPQNTNTLQVNDVKHNLSEKIDCTNENPSTSIHSAKLSGCVQPKAISDSSQGQKRKPEQDNSEENSKKQFKSDSDLEMKGFHSQVSTADQNADDQGSNVETVAKKKCDDKNETTSELLTDLPFSNIREIRIPDESEIVAMDCEFVGVGPRQLNALGRCSILDFNGEVLLDIYSKPVLPVTDYRTRWSGIREHHLRYAPDFELAKRVISKELKDKVVIGHAIYNDFEVLEIEHPPLKIRDTCKCKFLKEWIEEEGEWRKTSLKAFSKVLLKRNIQGKKRAHNPIEDALAALDLYKLVRDEWEEDIAEMLRKKFKIQKDPNK